MILHLYKKHSEKILNIHTIRSSVCLSVVMSGSGYLRTSGFDGYWRGPVRRLVVRWHNCKNELFTYTQHAIHTFFFLKNKKLWSSVVSVIMLSCFKVQVQRRSTCHEEEDGPRKRITTCPFVLLRPTRALARRRKFFSSPYGVSSFFTI